MAVSEGDLAFVLDRCATRPSGVSRRGLLVGDAFQPAPGGPAGVADGRADVVPASILEDADTLVVWAREAPPSPAGPRNGRRH